MKKQSNLEIVALELGCLTSHQRKVPREFLQKHNGMFAADLVWEMLVEGVIKKSNSLCL